MELSQTVSVRQDRKEPGGEWEGFVLEALGDGLEIVVSSQHTFGTDAFLLSDFAAARPRDRAADLGTGCGIVPLLWFRPGEGGRDRGPQSVLCVDIQPLAIRQLQRTVALCRLEKRVLPLLADFMELGPLPGKGLDLVTCNPPYQKAGQGPPGKSSSGCIARHETACTLEGVCRAAFRLLRVGGRLCICQRPERLADALEAMRSSGLEPKRLRFVHQRADKAPWLFLLEGRKGSGACLRVERPLMIEGEDGKYSPELRQIYRLP